MLWIHRPVALTEGKYTPGLDRDEVLLSRYSVGITVDGNGDDGNG